MDQSTFIQLLIARWRAETPTFFKRVQKISLYLSGIFGFISFLFGEVITSKPYSSAVAMAAGFLVTFFSAMATTAQFSSTEH